MNYKNIISYYLAFLAIGILHNSYVLPMLIGRRIPISGRNKWKYPVTIMTGITAGYVYDKNRKKHTLAAELLYLHSTKKWSSIADHNSLPEWSENILNQSASYNHIAALHRITCPHAMEENEQSVEQKSNDLLGTYYLNGIFQLPQETKNKLCSTIISMIKNEIISSNDHYVAYHGTDNTIEILFRTLLHKQINPNLPDEWLVLRNPGIRNPFPLENNIIDHLRKVKQEEQQRLKNEYLEKYGNHGKFEYVGQLFGSSEAKSAERMQIRIAEIPQEYNDALLSVNWAIMANSHPIKQKGSNSLRFLTDIQPYNDLWSSLMPLDLQMKVKRDLVALKQTIKCYGADPNIIDRYEKELQETCYGIGGMLIQFEIPKEQACHTILCESFNRPIGSAQEKLASLQKTLTDTNIMSIDSRHMVLPLSIFNDPNSQVKMHAIIRTDEETILKLTDIFDRIITEIKTT